MKYNIEELSVEELAVLIEQKVDLLKNESDFKKMNFPEYKIKDTSLMKSNNLYSYAKKIGKYLNNIGFYKVVYYVKTNFRIHPFYYIYIMNDFNKYYDEEFINNVFNVILKRAPSESEKNQYLTNLRTGEFSKTEVVSFIYFTKEAKVNNIKILGIKKRYFLSLVFKIPFIGYIAKTTFLIATLPRLLKRLNSFENYIVTQKADKESLNSFESKTNEVLEQKADMQSLNSFQSKTNEVLEQKADMQSLNSFQSKTNEMLEQKADMQSLNSFQNKTNEMLTQKADKKDFEIQEIPAYLTLKAQDFLSIAYKNSAKTAEIKNIDDYDLYYSLFESVFYPHDIVIQKQKVYLAYIPQHNSPKNPHLDIGCGRGEFLQNLKENKKYSIGIDINRLEIEGLKNKGYDVAYGDMHDYLKTSQKSFSSISALQVVEHIEFGVLKKFVALSYEKLLYEGVLILETINPHNPITVNSFYMDETHKRLIPPELLTFLLQWVGFKDIEILYTFSLPPEFRSKNDNSRNYHDYAVIGYKR